MSPTTEAAVSTDGKTGTTSTGATDTSKADAGGTAKADATTTTETTTKAADATTSTAASTEAATPASTAPAKYDFALPAGMESLLDAEDLKAFEAEARAGGLTQEAAQALLTKQATQIAEQSAAFRAQTEADPTWGGEQLQETQRLGNLALDRFAPAGSDLGDALRRDLVKTGYGNKLPIVSFLARIGKAMAEDQHVGGGGAAVPSKASSTEALAAKLYDKTG